MYGRVTFVLLTLAAAIFPQHLTTSASAGAAHSKRFCEGGGFNLVCGEGQQLHVSKAWFGRLAHDTDTCVEDVDVKAGNTSLHLQPDLARDCGVSVLGVKETWCRDVDSGAGCSIAVESLGVGVPGGSPCPVTVTKKYLYLEFACSRDGQASGALANTAPVRLFAMYLLMMSAGHALLASTLNNLNLV